MTKVIQLSHISGNQEHIIHAEVWEAQPATMTSPAEPEAYDILSCDLLVDGFRFDGILPDATILRHIEQSHSEWLEVEPQHPYRSRPSVVEVVRNPTKYSQKMVMAANNYLNQIANF